MITPPSIAPARTDAPEYVTLVGLPPRATNTRGVLVPPVPARALKRIVAKTKVPVGADDREPEA